MNSKNKALFLEQQSTQESNQPSGQVKSSPYNNSNQAHVIANTPPMPSEGGSAKQPMLLPAEEEPVLGGCAAAATTYSAVAAVSREAPKSLTTKWASALLSGSTWQSNLQHDPLQTSSSQRQEDVLHLLTRLYALDSSAIKALEKVRVNPDFTSRFRQDLEFYIPQLCSFYVRSQMNHLEDLVNLIVMASSSSFFFSHRVWFFYQSMIIGQDQESKDLYKKSTIALRGIKNACLNSKERLYLANSKDLVSLIVQFNLTEYYPAVFDQASKMNKLKSGAVLANGSTNKDIQTLKQASSLHSHSQGMDEITQKGEPFNGFATYDVVENQQHTVDLALKRRIDKVNEILREYCYNYSHLLQKDGTQAPQKLDFLNNGTEPIYKAINTASVKAIGQGAKEVKEGQVGSKGHLQGDGQDDLDKIEVELVKNEDEAMREGNEGIQGEDAKNVQGEAEEIQITAKDIILQPFMLDDEQLIRDTGPSLRESQSLSLQDEEKALQKNHAMNAYLSTPKFIKHLTDICDQLITIQNRDEFLREELKRINLRLPAAVYIPFVNNSIRNYAILHIVTGEAKVFQTKERAPLLLCFEAFRPEEMILLRPERPIRIEGRSESRSIKEVSKGKKPQAGRESPSQQPRSSSWNSSNQSELLLAPLVANSGQSSNGKKLKFLQGLRKTLNKEPTPQLGKDQSQNILVLPDDELAQIAYQHINQESQEKKKLSFRNTTKDKPHSKEEDRRMSTKALKEKEILKEKVNKLLDKKASNPLIINQLKRKDSILEKVKVNDNYFNNYLKQASNIFKINQKKGKFDDNDCVELKVIPEETDGDTENLIKHGLSEEEEKQKAFEEEHDPNAQLFKNLQMTQKVNNAVANNQSAHLSGKFVQTIKPSYNSQENKNYLNHEDARYSKIENFNSQSYLKDGTNSHKDSKKSGANSESSKTNPLGDQVNSQTIIKGSRIGIDSIEEQEEDDQEDPKFQSQPQLRSKSRADQLIMSLSGNQDQILNPLDSDQLIQSATRDSKKRFYTQHEEELKVPETALPVESESESPKKQTINLAGEYQRQSALLQSQLQEFQRAITTEDIMVESQSTMNLASRQFEMADLEEGKEGQQMALRRSNSEREPMEFSNTQNEKLFEKRVDQTKDTNHLTLMGQELGIEASKAPQEEFFANRPTNNIFLETSAEQDERVRQNSPFGNLKTWRLIKIIVKSNDDVRQEQFAMQLISSIDQIFKLEKCSLWLKPYEIISTGARCGLIEVVSDALSIDGIKRKLGPNAKLIDYFLKQFGSKNSKKFRKARDNFCQSLAAYSLVCFILQIKDRHNGNILVDIEGHIMHIDFGFLLSNAPGKGIKFELAPFKLTYDMVEVLGGIQSKKFREFTELMRLGFMAIQQHADKVVKLVEMMFMSQPDLPCFKEGEVLIKEFKRRIFPLGQVLTEVECAKYIDTLIQQSYDNWRTRAYDKFQYCCQGIL